MHTKNHEDTSNKYLTNSNKKSTHQPQYAKNKKQKNNKQQQQKKQTKRWCFGITSVCGLYDVISRPHLFHLS